MPICFGTTSPSRPSLPARPVPHDLPGIEKHWVRGSSTFGGHHGHRSQNPFLPAKSMVRVSLQSCTTHLPALLPRRSPRTLWRRMEMLLPLM